jgi:predicted nucleic acid-binding protein
MPENNAHFIDTNIWLYALLDTGEDEKSGNAQTLIKSSRAIINNQVVSEHHRQESELNNDTFDIAKCTALGITSI